MNLGRIPAKISAVNPSRTAIVDVSNDRRVSFEELNQRIYRLANSLTINLGLKRGERVAVLSKNSIEYFEIYFACALCGLIVQPLNWRLSGEELAAILNDGDPSVMITAVEFREECKAVQAYVDINTYFEMGQGSDGSYENLVTSSLANEPVGFDDVGGDDHFLILYTGGTTGISKGALHSHKSFFMGMLNQTVAERIVPSDVYMLTGQMFHIPIGLAMNYMAHGCPIVLINFEAKLALEVIQRERVSAFLGITTMLNWMMAVENFESYDLSSLRNIQYGGGPMPEAIVKLALKKFPCTLIQGYGQTEGMTMTFLSQEDHQLAVEGIHSERLASCGREGFVTQVRLLNAEGELVPRDNITPGEIVVRSEANMIGYWRNDELTAKTICNGWMKTGDIATWDKEGYIFIVDRAKDMIISGGENIYSIQVESAIAQHEAVLEVAVIGVPDDEWGESVKAIVVMKPGYTATEQEIIDTARQHLASYQKPRSVDFVTSLPKAPTGKILKRDLREPYWIKKGKQV
ncbi:MAG: AMP-binding protein [Emcibacter sp.]|nr:AMP-binding protein [Emcibacter sp.]